MDDSPYNDARRWADAGIYKPPLFDAKQYQKRIDRIVGVSPSGASIVRLSWAWDARKYENTSWDEYGVATAGEWRQKYRALTIDIGNDDYVDIAPPRWILEERFEPEAIAQSWELTRYRKIVTGTPPLICPSCHTFKWISVDQSEGHLLVCRFCSEYHELATVNQDVWGPVPREGWYNMLPYVGIIADHANGCCKRLWDESREICYGTYKEPDGRELKRLKKAVQLRSKEAATNPHIAPELDEVALQQAKVWGLQMMRDKEVRRRNELVEIRHHHRPTNNRVYA
jgi:hypothetical protein